MAYPTAAAIQAVTPVPALADLPSEQAEQLRSASIASIETFTGQSFTDEPNVTRYVNGSGDQRLVLPKRLHTLDSLSAVGSSLDQTDVAIGDNGSTLYVDGSGGSNWYVQAMREGPVNFGWGISSVTVTGDWGWSDAELPAADLDTAIAQALRLDMEAQALSIGSSLLDTIIANQRIGVSEVAEGPLRAKFDQGVYPMTVQVQELLRPYRWQTPGVVV